MRKLLLILAAGGLFASCAPSTPQTRIQQNPARFEALPASERALVESGEISRGMSREAVELSWGRPSGRFEGSRDGKITERWDYLGSRPVHSTQIYSTVGIGYGRYGGRYYPYSGYGIAPEVTYLPYRRATVWFVGGRVDSWETLR
jgi:hypothetical protein